MDELRFTLLGDGSFDRALAPILQWVLREAGVSVPIQAHWADLGRLSRPVRGLANRIAMATTLYPCDLLFIHRDAEARSLEEREQEIGRAIEQARKDGASLAEHVCVVPVRMTEAWLLFDVTLIRYAAGNPFGTVALAVPPRSSWESMANPKQSLHDLLVSASELNARRRSAFDASAASHRIAALANEFSALRGLSAFDRLENAVRAASGGLGLI